MTERLEYRLQLDRECLNSFRQVADIPEIAQETAALESAAEHLLAELRQAAAAVKPPAGKPDKWFSYADSIVPSRAIVGFPNDQVRVPKAQRRGLPDSMIYGPFARVLSNMDGEKTLQRLIREAEWEEQRTFTEKVVKKYLGAVMYLGDYGYLDVVYRQQLNHEEIVAALRRLGVKTGDCLLVHSSASALGRIDGGENAVIDALLELIGPAGTLLMPAFTTAFCSFDGTLNKDRRYRPFDKNNSSRVNVGAIPRAFLSRKGVIRSVHPSHSVAGIGPLAQACIRDHRENDPPTGKTSPFAKLVEFKAKILAFGCGLGSCTFLHFLETEANAVYLKDSVCRVREENGDTRMVYVPKNLPGDRDFYHEPAENSKFFRAAVANKLNINEIGLGLGKLRLISAVELYDIGMKLLTDDPDILLCDKSECSFCSKYRSN
ncbi:MAG: AAC(3) family N-acetyltransferase, partial [Victivallales bacterium]|nr:AAC(3) family N-acetyltransferase [Victivallales bacterium]